MNSSLKSRVVLVTGAAGDLGFAMARGFLAAGARVSLVDVSIDGLQARCADAGFAADSALVLQADIASAESSRDAVEHTAARFGGLHVLVNNAAVAVPRQPAADIAVEVWRHAMDVNVTGAWLMAKWAIPHLRAAGGGVILNMASQLGHVTSPGSAAYSATKAALLSLTRTLAVDYAADGIRAVSLSPGAVMTSRLTRRYGDEAGVLRALGPKHPAGRIATAEEIAGIAVFLAGDGAGFITGSDVLADGGYTAI